MKIIAIFKTRALSIITVLSFVLLALGSAQEGSIVSIKFDPPGALVPENNLNIRVLINPSFEKKNQDDTIHIKLTKFTDINNDLKYDGTGEITEIFIDVRDNQKKDEEPRKNEILTYLCNVEKSSSGYAVEVNYGEDKKLNYIEVPYQRQKNHKPFTSGLLRFFKIPYEAAQELVKALDGIKGNGDEAYKGENGIYVYNLKEGKLDKIIYDSDILYLSPTWSFDSSKIAFVMNQGEKYRIAWVDVQHKKSQILTDGYDDRYPFWTPDNKHIIFLRNNYLAVLELESMQLKVVDNSLKIEQTLGVLKGAENTTQVLYELSSPYTAEVKNIYMLDLNDQFIEKSRILLVNDPAWYFITAFSPSGDRLVHNIPGALVITAIDGNERLFADGNKYYEPAWSPDGNKIVFVSDRP